MRQRDLDARLRAGCRRLGRVRPDVRGTSRRRREGHPFLGPGGHDRAELVTVDRFGDLAAGVADEPGDLLDGDVAVGHQADIGYLYLILKSSW